jgi:DnaK suppressor protein
MEEGYAMIARKKQRSAGADKADSKSAGKRQAKPRKPSAKELATYKMLLLEKRRSLLGDLDGLEAEIAGAAHRDGTSTPSSRPDQLADFATDCHEMEMAVGMLASERALLFEISEALHRIANGTYGICEGTGQPIGKARLKARPWARHCIEHARERERGRHGGRRYTHRAEEGARIAAGTASWDDSGVSHADLSEIDRA